MRLAKLETDYWEMVEKGTGSVTKRAVVQYGNDLDTTKYQSGFLLKKLNHQQQNKPMVDMEDDEGQSTPTPEAVVAANAEACNANREAVDPDCDEEEEKERGAKRESAMGVEPAGKRVILCLRD